MSINLDIKLKRASKIYREGLHGSDSTTIPGPGGPDSAARPAAETATTTAKSTLNPCVVAGRCASSRYSPGSTRLAGRSRVGRCVVRNGDCFAREHARKLALPLLSLLLSPMRDSVCQCIACICIHTHTHTRATHSVESSLFVYTCVYMSMDCGTGRAVCKSACICTTQLAAAIYTLASTIASPGARIFRLARCRYIERVSRASTVPSAAAAAATQPCVIVDYSQKRNSPSRENRTSHEPAKAYLELFPIIYAYMSTGKRALYVSVTEPSGRSNIITCWLVYNTAAVAAAATRHTINCGLLHTHTSNIGMYNTIIFLYCFRCNAVCGSPQRINARVYTHMRGACAPSSIIMYMTHGACTTWIAHGHARINCGRGPSSSLYTRPMALFSTIIILRALLGSNNAAKAASGALARSKVLARDDKKKLHRLRPVNVLCRERMTSASIGRAIHLILIVALAYNNVAFD
ncbi:unnamed protein product [Trichogramma brassicae]|uniref:Uncharacterized protein n=1 Tax=Trichogramma brassicae TaxID=86971 RepID=A0A6H5IHI7_9HYME|nr:unnamed protein product [Trichogramma brassicae]